MADKSALLKKAAAGDVDEAAIFELYRTHRKDGQEVSSFRADIALKAAQFGYFRWPVSIRKYIRGKRILDVGCGAGTDSIGFITLGARSYVGIDPGMQLNSDVVKNKNGSRLKGGMKPKTSFGWTPNDISDAFPRITFFKGDFEELFAQTDFKKFDTIVMHTVTEHLLQIDEVFASFVKLLKDGGRLIYMHDNFYGWKGHHMAPKRVEDIDENDPEQKKYLDWNHILFDPPEGHYFRRALNRIRLDDLKSLTEKHFTIEEWREKTDDFGRLTEEIRARLPDYSERELTTSMVFCVASKQRGKN